MTDEQLRAFLADLYTEIRSLRIAHFQSRLCVQALRQLIQANADLEYQYGQIFAALEAATDARLFPASIAEIDQKIQAILGGS